MSIVIPMDMPKTCRECIEMKIPVQCRVIKQEPVTAVMTGYNRPEDCPLVELLPHGRLIDADKLLPESGYDPMMFKPKYGGDHRTQYNTLMGYEILGIVDDAPTILEASEE